MEDQKPQPRRRRFASALVAPLTATCLLLAPFAGTLSAQGTRRLVHLLHDDDFRVRVQAAFALGNTHDPRARSHLERALHHDRNSAVRAAAATGLGRLGIPRAIPALRRAEHDRSAAVRAQAHRSIDLLESGNDGARGRARGRRARGPTGPLGPAVQVVPREDDIVWPRVRYVVVLGAMNNTSGYRRAPVEERMRREVMHNLRLIRGLAVFDREDEVDRAASSQIQRRHLPVLRFEGNVRAVERRARRHDVSVRCEVAMMILDEPDRNIRGMLSGAATGSEQRRRDRRAQQAQEDRLLDQALTAAVRSAMSDARGAIHRAVEAR